MRTHDVERVALAFAQELGREAIELARGEPQVVARKTDQFDVITAADLAIEARFRERIGERFPNHAILGEEQGLDAKGREWTWVLDPIDGTFNFATGLPGAASSIALMRGGETRVAAIADFALDLVLSCRKGAGVTCDRGALPSEVGPASELGRGRLLIDPGHQAPDPDIFGAIQRFAELAPVVPRLIGSAAVSLAAVALTGGCFAGTGLELWDAAGGALLAEERGRAVSWWKYTGDSSFHVLAGEEELVRAFEPAMPSFIACWRRKEDRRRNSNAETRLTGPSDRIQLGTG